MEGCLRRKEDVSDVRRSVGELPAAVAGLYSVHWVVF